MRNEKWSERNVVLTVGCDFCGRTTAIYVTEESFEEFTSPNRRNVQDIFPYLDAEDRELLISHICPKCWEAMFSQEEDEEDCEEFYEAEGYVSVAELKEEW